ncbi:MAG: hypothetical protein WCR50_07610 [Proteiniphilum sp.]|jgi:hypothetical protein|nr:hypothetical protein [Proteiniphilum sp.]NCB24488.1 hypothetical protein [Bacteroidia bacterium]MDD2938138.1 hypothetical protein [Proteiniphilum sp.]MDD3076708.1 hypothetical protein [Proteiniphilum sp.]MDD3779553.1 hypothetical protein [Proteiniphilum sp.]
MRSKLLLLGLSALLVLFLGQGCTTDDVISDQEIQDMIDNSLNGQWQVIPVTINSADWEWFENDDEAYYSATVNLPELKDYIFDEGAALAYYKFNNNSKTALPYVKTLKDGSGIPYTETYSCDFVLGNPSTATFYLEASDAARSLGNPPSASFQIILIY